MANIDVKLTQAALDGLMALASKNGAGLIANLSTMMADAAMGVQDDSGDVSAYVFKDGMLRLDFPDQAYDQFSGLVLANPGALKGTASATGATLFIPGEGISQQKGLYHFSYDLTGPMLSAQRISSLTNTLSVTTLLPAHSPDYDTTLGNGTLSATGAIAVDADGNLSGGVSAITITADKLLASVKVSGALQLAGNVGNIVDSGAPLEVSGTLHAADIVFFDGSYTKAGALTATWNATMLNNPLSGLGGAASAGDDSLRIELPGSLPHAMTIAAGAGNDNITVAGGGGRLHVNAGAGGDIIAVLSSQHQIDGGAGMDTLVYGGNRAAYTIKKGVSGVDITGSGGVDVVNNVERIHFGTAAVAFDLDGSAGQAYRIYQAAFDRAPDSAGLGYWIHVLDGSATLRDVAHGFIDSPEFARIYGANPGDAAFVARLYDNVLHRPYDQAGFDYWIGVLGKGGARANVLAEFSESAENQAQVIGAIQNGVEFTLFG